MSGPGGTAAPRAGRVHRWTIALLLTLTAILPVAVSASALAPPPLPQTSTARTFAANSFIIDTGWMGTATTTQPLAEGLQPYGLLYQLLVTEKVPVYWIIAQSKTGPVASAPNLTTTTADLTGVSVFSPYTATTFTTKSYYSGPFVIPAEYMTSARLTAIIAAAGLTSVRVDRAAAAFTAPVYDKTVYWPKAVLDSQNGSIAQEFFANAKIPNTTRAYTQKAPSELNACDDIFVMPHADPTWAVHKNLVPFNDRGGYIWAGCHAASVLENVAVNDATNGVPAMNFLTTEGLLNYGSHAGGSMPYYYGENLNVLPWQSLTVPGTGTPGTATADRSDPMMQFIGPTEAAHQNGSEQIYMPNPESKYPGLTGASRWNPGVRFLSWDPTQADVVAGKSPGVAAADVYGRGFDRETNGLVMYEGGHSINKGSVGDTPAQRAFFNFLLMGGTERSAKVDIDRATLPATYQAGGKVPITATIGKGSPSYTYKWESTCGGTFSSTGGTTAGGTVATTWTAPGVNVPTSCQFRVVAQDSCSRQVFDAVGLTVMPVADLKIIKTSTPTVASTGSNITYTLTVTNNGPATADGVVVTDTLPAGLGYGSATPAPTSAVGQVVTWNLGTIANGATRTLTVTAQANQGGVTVQNTAVVTASTPDPNTTNNTAHATTQVINSGVSITKTAWPEIVPNAGGLVTFEFEVRNAGDSPLKDVEVTDNPGCTMSGPTGDLNGDGLLNEKYLGVDREVWRYSCTRTVTTATLPDIGLGGIQDPDGMASTKADLVTVTATDAANRPVSGTASATVTISTPGISVTKTLEPANQAPAPGDSATFRVLVSNTGNVPLNSVDTTDIWAGTCHTAAIPNLPVGGKFEMVCQAKTPVSPTLTSVATDQLAAISYTGGSGWTGGWVDSQDSSATAGNIRVLAGATPLSGPALPAGYSTPNVISYAGNKQTLARQVDLSGAVSASLRFLYQRSNDFNSDNRLLNVYASADGSSWTLLSSITPTGTNIDDTAWLTYNVPIPANLLGAGTRIRFGDTSVDLSNRWVHIDNVEVLKGTVVNSIDATANDPFGDPVPKATATAAVTPGTPSLSVTKSATAASPVTIGSAFNYSVAVTNTGATTQTGLVVTDTLPTGLTPNGAAKVGKSAFSMTATDNFGTSGQSYSTGTGWASPWTENGETTDPTGNNIRIDTAIGNTAPSLWFNPGSGRSVQRSVNLGGLSTATISFQCSREAFNSLDDELRVYVGTQLVKSFTGSTDAGCPTAGWGATTVTIDSAQRVNGQIVRIEMYGDRDFWIDNVTITGSADAISNVDAGSPPTLTSVPATAGFYDLAPGQTVTFTIPVTVTGAPKDGFQFSNLAQATSALQKNPVSASVITPYALAPGFSITKTAIETWANLANNEVTYHFELRNTGNSDLKFVSISDPLCGTLSARSGDLNSDGKLQVGEIWRYSCKNTVSSTDANPDLPDDVPNRVDATFTDSSGGTVTGFATANVKVLHPSIKVTAAPSEKTILSGGTVTYTYTLDNNGDVAITDPTVTAANCTPVTYSAGDTNNDRVLDISETWTFTCATDKITIDQTNQAVTATGNALIFGTPRADTTRVNVDVINPGIFVVKTAQNNAGTPGDPITVGHPNSVTYRYEVRNTGDTPLSQVGGVDNRCSPLTAATSASAPYAVIGDTDADGLLDPNETWLFTCGPVALGESTTNSVQFTARYTVGDLTGTVSASDTAYVEVRRPGIRLTKSANIEYVRMGGQVGYSYLVQNTGSTSFATGNLGALTDDKCAPVVFSRWVHDWNGNGVFDPPTDPNDARTGDQREYTCTATITAGMVDAGGRVTNIARLGSSTDTFGSSYVPSQSSASVFVINPDYTITKVATANGPAGTPVTGTAIEAEAGKPVSYTFTVAHTMAAVDGAADEINALSMVLKDALCAADPAAKLDGDGVAVGDTDANGVLNPGETWTYSCTMTSLPDGAPTTNTVKAQGTVVERSLTPGGAPVSAADGLGPITKEASATVTPISVAITVLKRALHCDVGVPVCDNILPGTQFVLYTSDPTAGGAGPGVALTQSPAGSATFVTAKLPINHDYWLVETRAPDGFELLPQPIRFHLTRTALTLDPASASPLITADAPTFTLTVTDVPRANLPEVGGGGALPFLAIGLLLITGAGLYYRKASGPASVTRRRP